MDDNWIREPIELTERDVARQLAGQINWWIQERGGTPARTQKELTTQLQSYIRLRRTHHWADITGPSVKAKIPEGWDRIKELLWQEWIADTYTDDEWETTVLDPVVGSLSWKWEPQGDWRAELFWQLPTWIERSPAIVALRDHRPPPPPPTEEEEQSGVDPYIAEQEARRRRRG